MPPMITTTSELSSQMPSVPLETAVWDVPMTAPTPASIEPTKNAIMKTRWMLTPSAETIARSSTPGADHHAGARVLEPQPEGEADHERVARMKRRAPE